MGGGERRVDEYEGGTRGACEALEELVEKLARTFKTIRHVYFLKSSTATLARNDYGKIK